MGGIQRLALAVVAVCLTPGCETTGALVSASQKGLGGLSCGEIYNTFNAYNRDRHTLEATRELSFALGIPYNGGSSQGYYHTAKNSANIALLAQGCDPL